MCTHCRIGGRGIVNKACRSDAPTSKAYHHRSAMSVHGRPGLCAQPGLYASLKRSRNALPAYPLHSTLHALPAYLELQACGLELPA